MAFIWTSKALREQIEINRIVQAIASDPSLIDQLGLLATPVIALQTIGPGQSGRCRFQTGSLDGVRKPGDKIEVMHNICSGSAIQANEEALAQRVMLPGGPGGWVVMRVCHCAGGAKQTYDCEQCAGRRMPTVSLSISGLSDLAGNSTFDGWGAEVEGEWDLSHESPFSACNPGIHFTVPDNRSEIDGKPTGKSGSPFVSGNFALRFAALLEREGETTRIPLPALQVFGRPLNQVYFLCGDAALTLRIDANTPIDPDAFIGNGVYPIEFYREASDNQMADDGAAVPKIDCSQTYSDYDYAGSSISNPFKTWLDQGTFQINP